MTVSKSSQIESRTLFNSLMHRTKRSDVLLMSSMKGRETPPDAPRHGSPPRTRTIETPSLPFETEPLKIRRATATRKVRTSLSRTRSRSTAREEYQYAVKFSDSTWGHTNSDTGDHYANRQEIEDVANNFDNVLRSISESDEIDAASSLQAAADLLLDNIESQLRAECREQSELVTRVRISYAHVFALMEQDAQKQREVIAKLEKGNEKLEENLTKIIDNATERVKEAQEDCARQIRTMTKEMEEKKEEYDTSMKRFLEQKNQLEEHVKALHRVFLDFQNDSVYITLEDLKQKQESLEKKVKNKDIEILKLQNTIQKQQVDLQNELDHKALLEKTVEDLRRKLKNAMATINRLERKIEMQENDKLFMEGADNDDQNQDPNGRNTVRGRKADLTPLLNLHQKLTRIGDKMVDLIQRTSNSPIYMNDSTNDDLDKLLLSCDSRLMLRAIEAKIDELAKISEYFETIDVKKGGFDPLTAGESLPKNLPRFLGYIYTQNQVIGSLEKPSNELNPKTVILIRQIIQSKYISDQWRQRIGKPPIRFPEFVLSFYCKDIESMFTSIQRCVRLWHLIKGQKNVEVKIFRKFLLEKYTVDELSFFLEFRMGLIGLPPISTIDEPLYIKVPISKCKQSISTILGEFSPIVTTIMSDAQQYVQDDYIDYAQFSKLILDYYQGERRKRRNAIRLMFQSNRFAGKSSILDFESFHSMVQSLGFSGSLEDILELHREASFIGEGELTLEGLLKAMDNLSFHFYSIELPAKINRNTNQVNLDRKNLLLHWHSFGLWFDRFRQPRVNFDIYVRSRIIQKINAVDKLFQTNAPASHLYSEYRSLLDYFQFLLNVMCKGKPTPMGETMAEKELNLIENLIDLLVTYLFDSEESVDFSEFKE